MFSIDDRTGNAVTTVAYFLSLKCVDCLLRYTEEVGQHGGCDERESIDTKSSRGKKILKKVHVCEKAPTRQPGLAIENFCVPGTPEGCYLVTVKGSEQPGLTGAKGSMVRKVAIDKTRSSLEKFLAAVRLERSWRSDVSIIPA